MKWWKQNSKWLDSQAHELSSSSTYIQRTLLRENLFVSAGEIVVRRKTSEKYPVVVVFPDATPYEPPKVYLLNRLPEIEDMKRIAQAAPDKVPEILKKNVKFYHRRHQGADGSLCIVEGDHLYAEQPDIFSIRQILDRVRDWFAAFSTGRFPPDSAEVELYYHFPNQAEDMEILVTKPFFESDIVRGIFCASLHKVMQTNDRKTYIGLVVVGEDDAGVSRPPKSVENPQNALFVEAPNVVAHLQKTGTNKKDIGENFLWGSWVDISAEIKPFSNIDDLMRQIGSGDTQRGYDTVLRLLNDDLALCVTQLFLGLRYPGRRTAKEWQIFQLCRSVGRAGIISPSKNDLIDELRAYSVKAIRTSEFTDSTYHIRNSSRAERATLKDSRVSILGCGALGGEIADALIKAGVGKMHFVDPDVLRPTNLVRHVLGMNRIGMPKAIGLHLHAILHNPFIDTDGYSLNIFHHDINVYFLDYSIGVSSIADDNVEAFLNQQAVISGKTIFYVRALRGGKSARIFKVTPGVDACKHCLSLYYAKKDKRLPVVPLDKNLPTLTNECNNPIRPASAADMKLIAGVSSRIILDYLQRPEEKQNHWIWSTESLPGMRLKLGQWGLTPCFIPRHPKCCLCSDEAKCKVVISKDVMDEMRQEAGGSGDLETGGILVGFRTYKGNLIIRAASGPGPKAVRKPCEFRRDVDFCQAFLEEQHRQFGPQGTYVGEWHYHPINSNQPSNRDLTSLSEIAAHDNYLTDKPVMIIFDRSSRMSCTIHPFNKRYVYVDYEAASQKEMLNLTGGKP